MVGAAVQYGARALEIATIIKLTRALWIVPVTLGAGMVWNRGDNDRKVTFTGRLGNSHGGAFLLGTYTFNFFLKSAYIGQKKSDMLGVVPCGG
ncbi:MAG TPA: hypothetical protein VKV03_19500 [Candidatus Binataceae bacterium]|nr:hypothetical protein [Candidatus Binataceae bacterium]